MFNARQGGPIFRLLVHTELHTTVGRTPMDEGSARRRDNTQKRQLSMPAKGFKPAIPTSDPLQNTALYRSVTGIGSKKILLCTNQYLVAGRGEDKTIPVAILYDA